MINTGCRPNAMPESSCGTNMVVEGKRMAICCCKNADDCNDDAFVAKCKAGTAPTSRPKGFTCVGKQPGSTDKNDIECSGISPY